jgi:hypothetical protein
MPLLHKLAAALLVLLLFHGTDAQAYSVLTHEELIDLTWNSDIIPALKKKYPNLTADQLKEAHSYAYGGAVIQDLGYYPFGNATFSDFAHYIRTGEFVNNLLHEAKDANEFAFAIGALSHYVADRFGHPVAVNRAVPIEYPELRAKFGDSVTYAQAKVAHLRTEFGFDVVQVAQNRYAPESYHDFIDFHVSKELMERAFQKTYGLPLKNIMPHEDLAIGSYRRAIGSVVPEMTKVALATRGDKMQAEYANFNKKKFLYNLKRADYEKNWGREYERPGIGARILSFVLRLVPKFGPFKALKYKDPTAATENLYFKSVNNTVDTFRVTTRNLNREPYSLDPYDLDTGRPTAPGEYSLTDETYAEWVKRLNADKFAHLTEDVKADILAFYANAKPTSKKQRKEWAKLQTQLQTLRAASTVPDANFDLQRDEPAQASQSSSSQSR